MTPIRCGAMNHVNAVIDDFDQTINFFTEVYGAQFLFDMPRDEWHACLIAIGRVIFQFFSPHDDLLHARFGPHYVGIEYTVPDVGEARDATNARGIRIARELGPAFHIHPLDAYGVSFEFFDHDFHAVSPPVPYLEPIRPIEFWRDDHPLGITGMNRYRMAVSDLEGAKRFLCEYVNGTVTYEVERQATQARAVGIELGDTVVELLSPIGSGPLEQFLARNGEGIRSVVFGTTSIEQARLHLASHGVELLPGDDEVSFAVRPADNAGLLFEFTEAPTG
jgi:catechol 2,3-dioxygenase-like lactoylglutathione lyase family enzyme